MKNCRMTFVISSVLKLKGDESSVRSLPVELYPHTGALPTRHLAKNDRWLWAGLRKLVRQALESIDAERPRLGLYISLLFVLMEA